MLYDNKRWDLDEVGRVLLDAADYMKQHGWCRWRMRNGAGEVCIIGAIDALHLDVLLNARVLRRVVQSLGSINIAHWNDQVCANKDEAVGLLQEAAYEEVTEHAL